MGRVTDSTAKRLEMLDRGYQPPLAERLKGLAKSNNPITDKTRQIGGKQEQEADPTGKGPASAKVTIDQRVLRVAIGQANVELAKKLGRNPTAIEIKNAISTSISGLSAEDVDAILRNTAKGQASNSADAAGATGKSLDWIPGIDPENLDILRKSLAINKTPADIESIRSNPATFSPQEQLDKAQADIPPDEEDPGGDDDLDGEKEEEGDEQLENGEKNPKGEKRPRDGRGEGKGLPGGQRKNKNEDECSGKSLPEQLFALDKSNFKFKKKGSEIREGIAQAIAILQSEIAELEQSPTGAAGGPLTTVDSRCEIKEEGNFDAPAKKIKRKLNEIERLTRLANNLNPNTSYELSEYDLEEYKL